ncbi:MAG: dihydroorotase [Candidatus Coatesbacteria bacterium]|nr:MAG: dihydroorotase [Candidatus Coatesbacteria bacterium]
MRDTILRGGIVLDPESGFQDTADVLIRGNGIEEIGRDIRARGAEEIEVDGLYVLPGLIDMHVHLREPGQEDKETIETGRLSAVKGGFTSIVCKANTGQIIDRPEMVDFIHFRAEETPGPNVFPVGAVTKSLKGRWLAMIGEMARAGVVALSDDGSSVYDTEMMREALLYAKRFNLPVISHTEDTTLTEGGSINAGFISFRMGLEGIPAESERIHITRDCLLARDTGAKLHIAHCSTRKGIEEVKKAKRNGIDVTVETAPHYFALNEEAVGDFETNAKMKPPLRSEDDRQAVVKALKEGDIDIISSDHAPHTIPDKDTVFELASFGIVGLETTLSLIITYLIEPGTISPLKAFSYITYKPADRLGLDKKGRLREGFDADITVIDMNREVIFDTFVSKGQNSPFRGKRLNGRAEYVFVGGKIVLKRGELVYG